MPNEDVSNEDFGKIIHDIQEKVDKIGEHGVTESTIKSMEEKIMSEINTKEEAKKAEAETKQTELDTKMSEILKKVDSMKFNQVDSDKVALEVQKKALNVYFKQGMEGLNKLPEAEFKTLSLENSEAGGVLAAPPFFEKEIIDIAAREFSPMRNICKVVTLASENRYTAPRVTAHGVASWTQDAGTVSEDTTYATGELDIPIEEMTYLYKVRNTLLQDAAFNIETELMNEYAQAFGLLEGTAFVSGTGVGRPKGFLENATIIAACVNSGSAGAVTADGLIDLWGSPKSTYVRNRNDAKWLMKRATMVSCVKLKDGTGQFLLGRLGDLPSWQILGSEVIETPDMPTLAGDAYSIAFGNFKVGYQIVDKIGGMVIIRDIFSSKTTRVVEFLGSRRVGGDVRIPEAIYVQKMAA